MHKKKVQDSMITMSHVMMPTDANPAGNVHGGAVMKYIDNIAGAVAIRHTRSNAVTASIDRLDFHHPVYVGNLLTLKAGVNLVGRTSMEVGVYVESENPYSGKINHTASAYLTMVALGEDGNPKVVPGLTFETDEDKRRNNAAKARRKARLEERRKEKECREDSSKCAI